MEIFIQALIIIGITGFFAMLEAALFTVSLSRAKVLQSQKKAGADALVYRKTVYGTINFFIGGVYERFDSIR